MCLRIDELTQQAAPVKSVFGRRGRCRSQILDKPRGIRGLLSDSAV